MSALVFRRKVDELTPFDDLLKDEQFWKDFEDALTERLSEHLLPVFLAGAVMGYRRLPKGAIKDWDEDLHPRDDHGRFAGGEGGGSSGGRPRGGNATQTAKMSRFEKQFKSNRHEHLLMVQADGTYRERTDDAEYSVDMTDEDMAFMSEPGTTMTHNHPINGAPLSYQDVYVAVSANAPEFHAVARGGWVSSMTAPDGDWHNAKIPYEEVKKAAITPKIVFGAMRATSQKDLNSKLNDYLGEFAQATGAEYSYKKVY